MTWEEYYDKFYDWAESTQIKKLSSVEALGPAEEVTEVMVSFAFDHEDIVNRIARKAIEQKIVFSGENIADLTNFIDSQLQNQLTLQSADSFTEEDLNHLLGMVDDDIVASLYEKKGYKIPDEYSFIDDSDDFDEEYEDSEPDAADSTFAEKQPSGFFSRLAMAFGVGHGISQGIKDATAPKLRKFRVGDHVRVRYRGQEGTIVDINGDLYMVSLKDGGYVDSYSESQLERAW
jgi:hypothetical protein